MRISALSFLFLLAANVAQAQADLDGRFHLSLEGTLFSYARGTLESGTLGSDDESERTAFGFPQDAGGRVGYLPLNALELGLLFSFARQTIEEDEFEFRLSNRTIAAYLRYVAPGQQVRFFLGPVLGAEFMKQDSPDADGELKGRTLVLGAELGVYGFVARSFSIDPLFGFYYSTGSLETDNPLGQRELDVSGFQVRLGLAISGWLN